MAGYGSAGGEVGLSSSVAGYGSAGGEVGLSSSVAGYGSAGGGGGAFILLGQSHPWMVWLPVFAVAALMTVSDWPR